MNFRLRTLEDWHNHTPELLGAKGGVPGPNEKWRTPSARGPNAIRSGRIDDFIKESPSWERQPPGADGEISVVKLASTTDLALNLNLALRETELAQVYLIDELAERAKIDASITSLSFQDFYQKFLIETLITTQVRYLDAITETVATSSGTTESLLPGVIRDMDLNRLSEGLLYGESYRLLSELYLFNSIPMQASVHAYLLRSGGLNNVYDPGAYSTLLARSAVARLESIEEVLNRIRVDLTRLEESSINVLISLERRRFEEKLDRLQRALDHALAHAESGTNTFQELVRAGTAIADVYRGISQSDPRGTARGIGEVISAVRAIRHRGDQSSEPDQLRDAIETVEREYKAFLATTAEVKSDVMFTRAFLLRQALLNRTAADGAKVFATGRFHDLVRIVLITHLEDKSRNLHYLRKNLIGAKQLQLGYPEVGPGLRLSPLDASCGNADERRCLELSKSRQWQLVTINDPETRFHRLPIAVVAPIGRTVRVHTFGHSVRVVDIAEPETQDIATFAVPLREISIISRPVESTH